MEAFLRVGSHLDCALDKNIHYYSHGQFWRNTDHDKVKCLKSHESNRMDRGPRQLLVWSDQICAPAKSFPTQMVISFPGDNNTSNNNGNNIRSPALTRSPLLPSALHVRYYSASTTPRPTAGELRQKEESALPTVTFCFLTLKNQTLQ